jgi:hypothetical protein
MRLFVEESDLNDDDLRIGSLSILELPILAYFTLKSIFMLAVDAARCIFEYFNFFVFMIIFKSIVKYGT